MIFKKKCGKIGNKCLSERYFRLRSSDFAFFLFAYPADYRQYYSNIVLSLVKIVTVTAELRYSCYGQMSLGHMLPEQMSPLQLESVQDDLSLKFGQNWASNS